MNYRITGDFRVPFRTESLAFETGGSCEEITPSQHMQNRMTKAWLLHCTALQHTYDFHSEDISICRAASAVQDRDYHQGHLYQVETRSCKRKMEFVRPHDLPWQSFDDTTIDMAHVDKGGVVDLIMNCLGCLGVSRCKQLNFTCVICVNFGKVQRTAEIRTFRSSWNKNNPLYYI